MLCVVTFQMVRGRTVPCSRLPAGTKGEESVPPSSLIGNAKARLCGHGELSLVRPQASTQQHLDEISDCILNAGGRRVIKVPWGDVPRPL